MLFQQLIASAMCLDNMNSFYKSSMCLQPKTWEIRHERKRFKVTTFVILVSLNGALQRQTKETTSQGEMLVKGYKLSVIR